VRDVVDVGTFRFPSAPWERATKIPEVQGPALCWGDESFEPADVEGFSGGAHDDGEHEAVAGGHAGFAGGHFPDEVQAGFADSGFEGVEVDGDVDHLSERYRHLPVTSLLKALERNGLVASQVPERVGNRPPRTVYELTEAGVADFRRKVEDGLRDSQVASVDLIMAVAYVGILPAGHARSILDARADRLDQELAALQGEPDGVAEVHMLEVAYWRTIIAAEAGWIRTLASRIRAHDIDWPGTRPGDGHLTRYLQVTLEPNFPIPLIDGSAPGVLQALTLGIPHARAVLDRQGHRDVRVGFSVAEPAEWLGGDDEFWQYLSALPQQDFAAHVDYVGFGLYPDAFSPVAPRGTPGDVASLTSHALHHLRHHSLPRAHIPPGTPIHIVENGTPSGTPRTEQGQCDSLSDMLDVILACRETLNITQYELFSLRDADSGSDQPTGTLGVVTDTYRPKPALAFYRDVIHGANRLPAHENR
jgi:hypothetical protein